jgi:hypothetical protein
MTFSDARRRLLLGFLSGTVFSVHASGDAVMDRLIDQAAADLAERASVEKALIQLLSFEEVTWPDASLGCPQPGMRYRQVPTDGYRILFRVQGRDYAYHGDGCRGPFYCPEPASRGGPPAAPRAET